MSNLSNIADKDRDVNRQTINLAEVKHINQLLQIVLRQITKVLNQGFETIDDSFFDMANMARSNNEQSRYFDAMREVRLKRKGIESFIQDRLTEAFSGTLNPAFHSAASTQQNLRSCSIDELALVDSDDLEAQVATETTSTNIRTTYQGALLQFQNRIVELYRRSANAQAPTPLHPDIFCTIMAAGFDDLDVDIKEKLHVLKHFGTICTQRYGEILETANAHLISLGILPNLSFKATDSAPPAQTEITTAAQSWVGEITETEKRIQAESVEAEEDSIETPIENPLDYLRTLLAESRSNTLSDSDTPPPQTKRDVFQNNEVLSMLNRLQQDNLDRYTASIQQQSLNPRDQLIDIHRAAQALVQEKFAQQNTQGTSRPQEAEKTFSQTDDDIINLVSMLFEFILDDYNLAPPIQAQICRLQIPILKVVLKNQSFFNKSTHPARKLLNTLAKSGIGWNEAQRDKRDKLLEQIQYVVRRILDEFDGDINLFETLYVHFNAFLESEEKRAALIEARTKQAELGRLKTQQAQLTVKDTLKTLTQNTNLPAAVLDLLENGWSRVMFLAYLKDEQEQQWEDKLRTAKELVWCMQPHADAAARERWAKVVPILLKRLKKGLQDVSYHTVTIDEQLDLLKQELTDRFKHPEHQTTKPEVMFEHDSALNITSDTALITKDLDPASIASINNIEEGDWLELPLINGNLFRCKLSAIMKDTDTYIFVNRTGLKVMEKSKSELVKDLTEGRLKILQQGHLVDRALNAVTSNLRKMATRAQTA
ncbi:MAG: DUF1631 domain-containing protein [Pseudomonadales bacterium]|nr:DUF1631 domain-containing protein [Pseudomonadales bacterium]